MNNSPFYKLVAKEEDQQVITGYIHVPVDFGLHPGRTISFSSNLSKKECIKFQLDPEKKLSIEDWIPDSLGTHNLNFGNIDRSLDPTRLAGFRYEPNSQVGLENKIITMIGYMRREDALPDLILLPFQEYVDLVNSLHDKVQFCTVSCDDQLIVLDGLLFQYPYGMVTILPDATLENKAYFLQMNTWKMGKVLTCRAPGFNGVMLFGDKK